MRDLFEIEWFVLPGSPSLSIEYFCHFPITVMVQQCIDLRDYLRLCLPNLSDGQRLVECQTPNGAAAKTHIDLDSFAVNQGHVFDEQAKDAFAFARFD
ncbi:MAG TPA: hypothetical protein VE135_23495 [Pyrinomonadaceae bacterium]|nr:hypothetical protein [Pyrinomonadaceae bacterium]